MAQTTPNHTQTVSGWAANDSSGNITPYVFKRRENGVNDVTIQVLYCGICHTDLHHVRNDWGITMYPVVPGHEITGIITKVGSNVTNFKLGDKVGVGYLAASCLKCEFCKDSQENYCDQIQLTYCHAPGPRARDATMGLAAPTVNYLAIVLALPKWISQVDNEYLGPSL